MLSALLIVGTLSHLDKHQLHVRHVQHLELLHAEHLRHEAQLHVKTTAVRFSEPRSDPRPSVSGGTLGCGGLQALWDAAGGAHWASFTAAEVAIAESGGNQYATGPVGERGYWQINPDHGSLSTYDPYGNARAAVIISADGTNWSAWTTYTSGAYIGRCLCSWRKRLRQYIQQGLTWNQLSRSLVVS